MEGKIEIVICLGSSCFARGNKATLQVVDMYIKKNKLESKVYFHGKHCFGKCANGPVVQIGEKIFEKVDSIKIAEILVKELSGL